MARAEAERQAALAEAHRRFVIEQELQRLRAEEAARQRELAAGQRRTRAAERERHAAAEAARLAEEARLHTEQQAALMAEYFRYVASLRRELFGTDLGATT